MLLATAWLAVATVSRAEPIVVVVSADWRAVDAIDLSELRAIYLGRRARWGGERVRRLELFAGSRTRAGLGRSLVGRSESELERYWIEQALSGGALPPRQMATPEAVIEAVRSRVGVLGFLPRSSVGDAPSRGLRILRIREGGVERGPEDPRYPLATEGPGRAG